MGPEHEIQSIKSGRLSIAELERHAQAANEGVRGAAIFALVDLASESQLARAALMRRIEQGSDQVLWKVLPQNAVLVNYLVEKGGAWASSLIKLAFGSLDTEGKKALSEESLAFIDRNV